MDKELLELLNRSDLQQIKTHRVLDTNGKLLQQEELINGKWVDVTERVLAEEAARKELVAAKKEAAKYAGKSDC